jgi:signal transduction histidine kinase
MNQKMKRHSGTNEILLACPDAVYVNGDSKRLRQVFANLIENGLKHSPPGCSVNVTIKSEGERVKVLVTDSGPGISQEDLPHIFERFYRVDKSRNRMDGGAGLGLSLVKSITEAHNGKVYVESVVNVGSVFIVDLPEIQQ